MAKFNYVLKGQVILVILLKNFIFLVLVNFQKETKKNHSLKGQRDILHKKNCLIFKNNKNISILKFSIKTKTFNNMRYFRY